MAATFVLVQTPAARAAGCDIVGTPKSDRIVGTSRSETICGGGGNDVILGGGGRDTIIGGAGRDTISGGAGADSLSGGLGGDKINGGVGNDTLLGGDGNDVLAGGQGADVLTGGIGTDLVSYAGASTPIRADLDGAADDGAAGEHDRISRDVENLTGGSGSDQLTGNGGANTLVGGLGADTLAGGSANDYLSGGSGDDAISGNEGADRLFGGPENDLLIGGGGVDVVDGGSGTNSCDFDSGEAVAPSCLYDSKGPAIVSLAVSKATVRPGDTFTITAKVNDPAGVAEVAVTFMEGGMQNDLCDQQLQRTGGTVTDGTWTRSCTVPTTVRNGTYEVTPIARDRLNNYTNTNGDQSSPARAYVDVIGGVADSAGPQIVSLDATPSTVRPGDAFTVSAHVTDPSGVAEVGVAFMVGGVANDLCGGQQLQRTGGTVTDGTWTMSCTVPTTVRNGTYEVTPFTRDRLNNYTNMNGDQSSPVRAHLNLTGGVDDSTGPHIVSLAATPATVHPGDRLTITAHVTDPSGAAEVGVTFMVNGMQNDLCGQQLTLTGGTAADGTWTMSCTVPTARSGTYEVTPFTRDQVNNWTNMNGDQSSPVRAYVDLVP